MRDTAKLITMINIEDNTVKRSCKIAIVELSEEFDCQRFTYSVRCCFSDRNSSSVYSMLLIVDRKRQYVFAAIQSFQSIQCESSTVFLNLRMFGMDMENKYLHFIGGLGALIT